MPVLLALDLSGHVGWALLDRANPPPTFGTLDLPKVPEGEHGRRFAALREWMIDMWRVHKFDAVAYEKPILPRKSGDLATTMDTLTLLWGLTAVVQLVAAEFKMPPAVGISVPEVKKALTNKQHATKDEMIYAARRTFGWRVTDDHQADACACGLAAYSRLWPKVAA